MGIISSRNSTNSKAIGKTKTNGMILFSISKPVGKRQPSIKRIAKTKYSKRQSKTH